MYSVKDVHFWAQKVTTRYPLQDAQSYIPMVTKGSRDTLALGWDLFELGEHEAETEALKAKAKGHKKLANKLAWEANKLAKETKKLIRGMEYGQDLINQAVHSQSVAPLEAYELREAPIGPLDRSAVFKTDNELQHHISGLASIPDVFTTNLTTRRKRLVKQILYMLSREEGTTQPT